MQPCAAADAYATSRAAPRPPVRTSAPSAARRATSTATMFAIDDPASSTPLVSAGMPTISAAQAITWRSISMAAWSRPAQFGLNTAVNSSASMPAALPPPFTQPIIRGCSLAAPYGSTSRWKSA